MLLRLSLAALAALILVSGCQAWGGNTHQWISLKALDRAAPKHPALRGLRAHPEWLAAYLGTSMGPDMSVSFLKAKWPYSFHKHLHKKMLADTLLELAGDNPIEIARALGWRAHQVQDSAGAHGTDSYPSRKGKIWAKSLGWRGHLANELLLDLLVRAEPSAPRASLQAPVRLLAQALVRTSATEPTWLLRPDSKELSNFRLAFACQVFLGNTFFDGLLLLLPQSFLDSLGQYFADALPGDSPGQGLEPATRDTVAMLLESLETHPRAAAALARATAASSAPVPDTRIHLIPCLAAQLMEIILGKADLLPRVIAHWSQSSLPMNTVIRAFLSLAAYRPRDLPSFIATLENDFRTVRSSPLPDR